uniref:hypothetical protein n=1 Tax=Enterovirga sp. TaxID=2026350 RepID=UPI002CCCF16A
MSNRSITGAANGSAAHSAMSAGDRVMDDSFRSLLFSRVPAEDLAGFSASALATLADSAYAHLAQPRSGGQPVVALRNVTVEQHGKMRELTVLDAVNDDMPFLLDSTLAELVKRGLEPQLVAHPILGVERDGQGGLVGLGGDATAESAQAPRR